MKPTFVIHYQSADGLENYQEMGSSWPPMVIRRLCFRRLLPFTSRIDFSPTPVREYEYQYVEKRTKTKLTILYKEKL